MATWHHDLPPATEEVWDVVAKALMLRAGGTVTISKGEIEAAKDMQAVIRIELDGSIRFRVEGH